MNDFKCLECVKSIRKMAFVVVIALLNMLFSQSCDESKIIGPKQKPDLILQENENSIFKAIEKIAEQIDELANNPGTDKNYLIIDSKEIETKVKFGFHKDKEGITRPAFTKESGERAYLRLGFKGITPSILMEDNNGNQIDYNSNISSKFSTTSANLEFQIDSNKWIRNSIALIGAGIAAWLGLSAVQFIAAGLGTIAVAAIFIGGAMFIAGFTTNVLNQIGFTSENFIELFSGSIETIKTIILQAAELIK